jgi:hypothetical protein
VNPELLFHLSTGLERSENYFNRLNVEGDFASSERSEQGVSLTLIEGDMSKVAAATANNAERYVSLDAEFIETKGLISLEELKKELKDMNSKLHELFPAMERIRATKQQQSNKAPNKLCCIEAVIRARDALIVNDADWVSKRRAELKTASESDRSADDYATRRDRELLSTFYSFEGTDARATFSFYYSSSSSSSITKYVRDIHWVTRYNGV